jgi:hypothetical protein
LMPRRTLERWSAQRTRKRYWISPLSLKYPTWDCC